ncbi:hypothetical protein G7066_12500 [Leucobacter coleopterorum]|uniref:Uncharacterized protein n=1 Tax=Leucobacter coleopterorum TaxID=2714933 RepID=A0ABX6JY02_9MICO|nr:hypothetical protein [Leucobacter coleopterorum]QIM19181.1 hypothetical protein G7066_12500 [Leucobacter coleopterorum]
MGKQNKKRQLWHKTPHDGVPGIYAATQRFLYQFQGPAQLGDRNESAHVAPPDPNCPACRQPLQDHHITPASPGKSSHMQCPPPKPQLG